ncbi:MAG TPA: NAD(P)/FAD-dependent oxidoreductase [Candidatus Limnocylindrales bacterium]|nr:NAD(P)/FAD-dependent oxidoreductase [Candidatus Limnocylindrales bacterium]
MPQRPHHVVIVGGGFGGLNAAQRLAADQRVEVTLVDRHNYHLFQPLLYQVATGALAPGEIAQPLRSILRRYRNVTVLLGEAVAIDPAKHEIELSDGGPIPYDTLVVATGAHHSYFGHDAWSRFAPGLKSIDDATEIRRRILIAFEAAEREHNPERRREWMTFVVVGGGPTGVELAGSLGEIAHDTLRRDFRSIVPAEANILLLEGLPRVLPPYPDDRSRSAKRQLEHLGVVVRTGALVTDIDEHGVTVTTGSGTDHEATERIPAKTVIWAAGVQASSFGRKVAAATGAEVDRSGRVRVGPDLALPGHPEIFVIGDAAIQPGGPKGGPVPGVAQGAIQPGRYVAATIRARLDGRGDSVKPFHYVNRGDVAVIGRLSGVTNIPWLGPLGRQSGFLAWALWLGIHLVYLIGFANRIVVLTRWAWSFLTHGRGSRLITGQPLVPEIEEPEPPA